MSSELSTQHGRGMKSEGYNVILVHLDFPQQASQDDLEEFKLLATSAGANIQQIITGKRQRPDAKYFVGSGKAIEIQQAALLSDSQLVIFNHSLTPAQERNLERLLQARVLDRTGLILDIFAARARSFAGKLQVELAQLEHLATRLVRGWSHLERQKGGIGLRGPGETQLETDRRLLRERIKVIKKRLEKVQQQRQLASSARARQAIPTVSLVGYTNAGKSTLFNQLVGDTQYTADQLFATLDPTLRRLSLPQFGSAILADTVGFIRDIPHQLIESFHATLEETRNAELLIHVIDAHDPERHQHAVEVLSVLKQIGADQVPRLEVYNKIDLIEHGQTRLERDDQGQVLRVCLSAIKNKGIDFLLTAIAERLSADFISKRIILIPAQAELRAKLYAMGGVLAENVDNEGNHHLTIRLSKIDFKRLFGERRDK